MQLSDRHVNTLLWKRSWRRRSSVFFSFLWVLSCCLEVLKCSWWHLCSSHCANESVLWRNRPCWCATKPNDSEDSDDSLKLPHPSEGSEEGSDFHLELDDSDDDAWSPNESVYSAYEDWLFHLEWDDNAALWQLYKFKLLKTASAAEVASILGICEKSVRQ